MSLPNISLLTKAQYIITTVLNFCKKQGGKRKDEPLFFGKMAYRQQIRQYQDACVHELMEQGVTHLRYDSRKMQFTFKIEFDGNAVTCREVT